MLALAILSLTSCGALAAAELKKPNIVVIVADDLGYAPDDGR